ncbi:MAG: archaemetzincin family Zn-dependent metalloprotease [Nitrososphaerota archaeon]
MRIKLISEFADEEVLREIAEALRRVYGEVVEIELAENLIGKGFLDRDRGQYDAWKIVQYYREMLGEDEYILLVTDKDLYAAGLNFVFGLAWRGVAIISVHRLFPEFYGQPPDRGLLKERAVKEAVHEVGHLHGLMHCDDRRCVMAFSNSIIDTDYKMSRPCRRCLAKLRLI